MRARAGSTGSATGAASAAPATIAAPAQKAGVIRRAGGPTLDRRRLQLAGGIKSLGRHQVPVVLHPEVTATIPLEVVEA